MKQELAWSILGIMALFAIIFSTLPIAGAWFFRPRKANIAKNESYECGLVPKSNPHSQLNIQYYLFALAFLIFSIEILFVYPWAINFKTLGLPGLLEMFVFLAIMLLGLIYAWKKGALEWK